MFALFDMYKLLVLLRWINILYYVSFIRLEQAFSETLHRHFPAVNTCLTMSQSAIDAAKSLLKEEQLTDPVYIEQLSKAEEIETATSEKAEKMYNELLNDLVDIAENSNGLE